MKFILAIALFCLVINSSAIRVGFFSANIEGYEITSAEFEKVFKLFNVIDDKKGSGILNIDVMNSNKIKSPSKDVLNNYDLILISLQETNTSQKIDLSDLVKENKDWQCHPMQFKNGFTKFVPKYTAVSMCNNKTKLKYFFDKTPFAPFLFGSLIPTDLKAVFGRCFEDLTSKNKEILCFLGGHLETDLINGASRISRLFKYIENKIQNRPYSFYVLGDLNVRNWIKIDKSNVKQLETDFNNNDLKSYIKGDVEALTGFQGELDKSIKKDSHFFNFVGNNNLRSLPFTYNYIVPDKSTDVSKFEHKHFRLECATQYKKAVEGKDVSNYGWLDRLACGYNKAKGSCKIKGGDENVNYFMVPFLRKADHMPMIGSFEISSDDNKLEEEVKLGNISNKDALKPKVLEENKEINEPRKHEILTASNGTAKELIGKFEDITKKDEVKKVKADEGKIVGKSKLTLSTVNEEKLNRKLK